MSDAAGPSIDIGKQQIGKTYAKALLGAGIGDAESVVTEFGELREAVLDRVPNFLEILESPRVSIEEKLDLLDRTLKGRVSDTLLRFLKVVCERERMDCLDEIYRETRRQFNASRNVIDVQVTTAKPIDSSAYSSLIQALETRFGAKLDVETYIDPKLIGGVVVRIGDQVYDGSVAQKLQSLKQDAVAKAVEKMREDVDRFAASA